MLLNDLLVVLAPRIDHTRVVKMFQKADELPSKAHINLIESLTDHFYLFRSDKVLFDCSSTRKFCVEYSSK